MIELFFLMFSLRVTWSCFMIKPMTNWELGNSKQCGMCLTLSSEVYEKVPTS